MEPYIGLQVFQGGGCVFFCHLSGLFTSAPDCFDEFVYIEEKDVDGCVACFSAYLHQKCFCMLIVPHSQFTSHAFLMCINMFGMWVHLLKPCFF